MMNSQTLPLTNDASDFEIAIRGAAMLDSHLQNLLSAALYGRKSDYEELFKIAGRIKTLAFCVGLISQEDYHDLRLVGSIRNRFAHPTTGNSPSFDCPAIMSYIGNLNSYQQDKERGLNGRAIFVATTYHLASQINHKLAQVRLYKARKLQAQRASQNETGL